MLGFRFIFSLTPKKTVHITLKRKTLQMSFLWKSLHKLPTSRLSRRLVFIVFLSILVIEGIILIPSVLRREREFFQQLKEVSEGQVILTKQIAQPQIRDCAANSIPKKCDRILLEGFQKLIQLMPTSLIGKLEHRTIGGAFYRSNGQLIGAFGEVPQLSFTDIYQRGITQKRYGSNFDAGWTSEQMEGKYILILRHDASTVPQELQAFIWRIAGLVLIISVFVTGGVWIALEPIVVTPILQLRKDLISGGEAIAQDREPPQFYAASIQRRDELGDVIAAFEKMFQQVTDAISDRKKAELALQQSLDTVQAYSDALDKELDKGREIQRNFLPSELLQTPGWEIAAFFKPARQVAGDFYDTFELPSGAIALIIADVCDKGVGAALFMALFRSLIRIFAVQTTLGENASASLNANLPLGASWMGKSKSTNLGYLNALQAVCLTNNYVAQYHGDMGMFATLFFGVLEPDTGLLTYINGGHEPLFILDSAGGVREHLSSTGPAVGMLPDLKFKIKQTYLQPGEVLLGYTDGVPEARAADSKFFTAEKLLSMLSSPVSSAQILLDKISTSVIAHTGKAEQFDDITLLAVRRLPDGRE